MTLTLQQKQKIIQYYPELRNYFDLQELKDKSQGDAVLAALVSKIQSLKGDKGDKPIKGIDYWTSEELDKIIAYILQHATPLKGVHYEDGEDGKDYVLTAKDKREIAHSIEIPVVEKIIEKIEVIKEVLPKEIDISRVKGAVSKKDLEDGHKKILDGMARQDGRIKLIDQRWGAHGGGSKSTGVNILSATGTIDDNNTAFSFTDTPTLICINGAFYQSTGGAITWTGTTSVTLSSPVGVGGSIFGIK